jgi:polyisoprenyl-phosphate glycosyltransferase
MVKKKTVAVIVPCYNEGNRISNVLKEIKKSRLVNEIVVVDDGSDEETKKVLVKASGIRVITHRKNLGKSQAMKTGVLNVKSDIVVFIDGDLSGFKGSYVDGLVKPIIKDELDFVLGDREREFWVFKLLGLSVVLTGERAINRDLLLENMEIFNYGGFLAEVEMNKIFFKGKRVGKFFLKGVGQMFKYKKYGVVALLSDFDFLFKLIKLVGLRELKKQRSFVKKV